MKSVLGNDEKIIFKLRELYAKYGYQKYRMSKFEEYDLYVRNKDFLVSENIITFTDVDGKLMALKPDVTLSIIKNSRDAVDSVQKMYYNENVYRASSETRAFKEIMQTGLECIGDIDDYSICEVMLLAAKSLDCIDQDYILDISHMGVVSEVIDGLNISQKARKVILKSLGEKNAQEIVAICESEGVDAENTQMLKELVVTYGKPQAVIPKLKSLAKTQGFSDAVAQLETIADVLESNGIGERVRIDFSVINDMSYYSGVVFKGFVNGVPGGVLSGGQYDNLMKKMHRTSGAIGFAVYLDILERLWEETCDFDVDTVIIYDENADVMVLNNTIKEISKTGESVLAQKAKPEKLRYKKLLKLNGTEVETLENNA